MSDLHMFSPHFYAEVMKRPRGDAPSRLSTELALGDKKANPLHALMKLVRDGTLTADSLLCCGDFTTSADPTAMNLAWLQIHRLAAQLDVEAPLVTMGNHDVDSRFQTSTTSPSRMLRYLDPPFPVDDDAARSSYWANGYCIVDRSDVRFVLVNTCSLHGYVTEEDRKHDHGFVPEGLFSMLAEDLASRPHRNVNVLVCHHHPLEIDAPPEDHSVITNGAELVELLESLAPPAWLVLHGHRHLPKLQYAGASPNAPIVFSVGSFAASLHLQIQGRTANQFYEVQVEYENAALVGRYQAWTWDQHEGEWLEGEDTRALVAAGGFGYRPDAAAAAGEIAPLVPPHSGGTITWFEVEQSLPMMQYVLPDHRKAILQALETGHGVMYESDGRDERVTSRRLRLGRSA